MGKQVARDVWSYDTLQEFNADGGAAKYGVGAVWIGGTQYVSNGTSISPIGGGSGSKSNIISIKPAGNNLGVSPNTNTIYTKFQVDAPFDAIRFVMLNHDASNALASYKAVVAATETAAEGSTTGLYDPIVGGSAVTALDSTTDAYGWKTVKWAGSATGPSIAAPSDAAIPGAAASDWIPCSSVPRADGGSGYLAMVRVQIPATATNRWGFYTIKNSVIKQGAEASRQRLLQTNSASSDGVGTLTNNPGGTTLPATGTAASYIVQFRTMSKVVTVVAIGDSITQNSALVDAGITSWGWRGTYGAANATGIAAGFCNFGANSKNSATYLAGGLALMDIIKPHIAIYSPWTPNESFYSSDGFVRYNVQNFAARLQDFLDYCSTNNILPIVWTGLPFESQLSVASRDNIRKDFNARLLAMSNEQRFIVLDYDGLIGDGATPEKFKDAYRQEASGSGVHPNEAGIEAIAASILTPALIAAFYRL